MNRRYVYHKPDEVAPRGWASGQQNILRLGVVPALAVSERVPACPAWGCGAPPFRTIIENPPAPYPVYIAPYGATASVPQPPPPAQSPGSVVVANPGILTLSPAPSPTVAVSPTQTAPTLAQPGTTLDSSGASVTTTPSVSSIGTWLSESTLISGWANWEIAGAGLLAAFFLFRGKGRR